MERGGDGQRAGGAKRDREGGQENVNVPSGEHERTQGKGHEERKKLDRPPTAFGLGGTSEDVPMTEDGEEGRDRRRDKGKERSRGGEDRKAETEREREGEPWIRGSGRERSRAGGGP
uniref:Uncharacterized protein n=1 Tax=Chromera velia CCMP2878 TaxID=1169474 RepID=A0A0G4FRF9_9ALVE|eukprot:Cvel_18278.t1-p1 / transcript=Cvel_18278.t1 / gene=Cvel_18278 / organism=Chromera_velia_CCMP2878 / gene_product=hypothetical protein / transcript_product=hypothetical protein / location=Cvel_scaffold1506:9157-9504(+) / protein_length=116 / sequence_SO=supercontig / SO=protein_coding / is_pseudo=false